MRKHPRTSAARGATELAHAFAAARDGEMNAFMQLPGSRTASKRGVFYNMTASSLQDDSGIPMNRHEAPTSSGSTEATVRVPTLDFARWLSSNFCSRDHVHVKMDIEGRTQPAKLRGGGRGAGRTETRSEASPSHPELMLLQVPSSSCSSTCWRTAPRR